MKKIIDGKIYNTETATLIYEYVTSGLGNNDFRYEETGLYKTKKGRFFLAGQGHAMTRWAKSNGNTSGWGSGMEALTAVEALEWLEKYYDGDCDNLIQYFNDDIEEA